MIEPTLSASDGHAGIPDDAQHRTHGDQRDLALGRAVLGWHRDQCDCDGQPTRSLRQLAITTVLSEDIEIFIDGRGIDWACQRRNRFVGRTSGVATVDVLDRTNRAADGRVPAVAVMVRDITVTSTC